jgi:hypothetical protein
VWEEKYVSTGVCTRRLPRRKKRRVSRPKEKRSLKPAPRKAAGRRLPSSGTVAGSRGKRDSRLVLPSVWPAPPRELLETSPESSGRKTHVPARPGVFPEPRPTPEEEELRRKRAQLAVFQAELARKELRLANLRADVLPFETRYVRKIGIRCARLDEIEAQIAEIAARRDPRDSEAREAARRARTRADQSRAAVLRHVSAGGFDPPAAVKRLYRAVARRVHPDFGEDPADCEVRERLMAHANHAYERCDERRLRGILDEYEFRPEGIRGEGTPLELVRVIRGIAVVRGRLEEIDEETDRTRSSDLFRFKERAEAAAKHGRNLLAEVAGAVDARIAAARRKLKHLSAAAAAH